MTALSLFIFIAFLMLFLGVTVYVHDPRNIVNRFFLFWVAFVVIWMNANYLENVEALHAATRELMLRIDFATAIFGASLVLLFVMYFLQRKVNAGVQLVVILPAIALATLSFSPLMFDDIYYAANGEIKFEEGIAYFFYAPSILIYFIASCWMLFAERRVAQSAMRAQATWVGVGLLSTTITSAIVNLYFQNILSADALRVGIYSFLFFIFGVTWAITKHEFLRIRFLAAEVLFLGILTTLLTRTLLSRDLEDLIVSALSFCALLILGFVMMRGVLMQNRQREELEVLSRKLQEANKELHELDKAKSEFINIASHQLRTPVSVIKGYLALLDEGAYGKLTAKMKEKVHQMFEMNERLVHLINNFLNMSRIEKKRIEFLITPADLSQTLEQAVEEMRFEASGKKLELRNESAGAVLPLVKADIEKVHEVMINLIDNAVKYSEAGTRVTVSARPDAAGDFVTVSVADRGIGLTEVEQARLFEKYYRAESKDVPHQQGSGLGLYICKTFIEGMGGRIWIESSVKGKGTTFAFALPIDKEDTVRPTTPA